MMWYSNREKTFVSMTVIASQILKAHEALVSTTDDDDDDDDQFFFLAFSTFLQGISSEEHLGV